MDEARLIAWIDGALSPEEARAVAAAVAADPELAARADQHRRARARYQKAFGGLIAEAAKMPQPRSRRGEVVPISIARARNEARAAAGPAPAPRRSWWLPLALAASLSIGIVTGMQVRPLPGIADEPQALRLDGALAEALDRTPSGAPSTVRIAESFRDRAGAWCRSFAAAHLAGVACHRADGAWQLRYAGSAGDTDETGRAIAAMIAGRPADAAAERRAIAAHWR